MRIADGDCQWGAFVFIICDIDNHLSFDWPDRKEVLMVISREIQYESLDQFRLDPENPRLRHLFSGAEPTQKQVLDEMENWKRDELAVSFLSSGGFWVQEAILVLPEQARGRSYLTVVEGNRRIAALMKLKDLLEGGSTKSNK